MKKTQWLTLSFVHDANRCIIVVEIAKKNIIRFIKDSALLRLIIMMIDSYKLKFLFE